MQPVATVLGSVNLQNVKTLVFWETLEGKIIEKSTKLWKHLFKM